MVQISEKEWEEGSAVSASENKEAVLKAFGKVAGKGMDMKEIAKLSGLKWPYGAVKALVEDGKLERKQFGKKFGYRMVEEKEE